MKTFVNLFIVATMGTMLTSPIMAGQQTTAAQQTSVRSESPTLDRKHQDKTRTRDRSTATRVKKERRARIDRVRPSGSPRLSSSLAAGGNPIIAASALADTVIRTTTWGDDSSIASRDDGNLEYSLPFTFPYFGRSIVAIDVNTNGLLELLESGESCDECGDYLTYYEGDHIYYGMDAIFAMNDDLITSTIIEGLADAVKVSWFGSTYYDDDVYYELSFSVTLFSDGRIQWKYFDLDYSWFDGDLFSGLYDAVGGVEIAVPGMPTLGEPVHKLFEFDPAAPGVISELTWNTKDISLPFDDDADLYYYGPESDYYSLPFTFPFLGRDIVQINVNTNGLVELLEVGEYDVNGSSYDAHIYGYYNDAIFVADDDLITGLVVEGTSQQVDIYWYGLNYNDYYFDLEGMTMKLTLYPNGGVKWTFFDMNYTYYDYELYSGLASVDAGVDLEVPGGSLAFQGVQVYTAFRYNGVPTAAADAATTDEDNAVIIDVLANDTEAEGDPLSVVNVTQGTYGAVVDNGDGTVTYTPETDYNGADSFTYAISDGISGTDTATVSITVTPVNDAPVAIDDARYTPEDNAVTIFVLANDSDVEGDVLTVAGTTQGSYGSVSIAAGDTSVTYTPNLGYNGFDSFTYQVSDGAGGLDTATVNVTIGTEAPHITSVMDIPDDQGRKVYVTWNRSYLDLDSVIAQYGIKLQNPEGKWVSLGTVTAEQADSYIYLADSFGDSTATGTVWSRFQITAHIRNSAVTYTSPVDSGYSIDNVAPAVPTGLMASVTEGPEVALAWNGPVYYDFDFFRVYRQATGTEPISLIETSETSFIDIDVDWGQSYEYWLKAVDVNGNESGQSQTLSVGVLGLEGATGLPTAFAFHPNYPNPFNPSTTLRFDLPEATEVYLAVHDILGREVVRLVDGRLEAGYHQQVWDGRDRDGREVPTGIYFVLVVTPEFRQSIKTLLLK